MRVAQLTHCGFSSQRHDHHAGSGRNELLVLTVSVFFQFRLNGGETSPSEIAPASLRADGSAQIKKSLAPPLKPIATSRTMDHRGRSALKNRAFTVLLLSLMIFLMGTPALAQSVSFLPEVSAHLKLNSYMRAYLQAKDDRDEGVQDQFSIGPSLQFYLKPLVSLKRITAFDLDDAKPRPVVLEAGYRYITAPNMPSTNRMQPMLTFHFPLLAGILVLDRNRADLDWKSGGFNWRYRNRLTVERTFSIHSFHFIPFVAGEPYYVDLYHKWSTTDLYAGCQFPAGNHLQFNIYYEHENNTGKKPNQSKNEIGLTLNLFFPVKK
jgi:hypothetical protein